MSRGWLCFLNVVLASVAAIVGGVVAFVITATVYILTGLIVAILFRVTIFLPTMIVMWIVYAIEAIAIAIPVYRYCERTSRKCVTA